MLSSLRTKVALSGWPCSVPKELSRCATSSPRLIIATLERPTLVALEEEACRRGLREVSVSSTRTAHSFYLRNEFVDEGSSESTLGLDSLRMRKAF
jgi:hypothetical protein